MTTRRSAYVHFVDSTVVGRGSPRGDLHKKTLMWVVDRGAVRDLWPHRLTTNYLVFKSLRVLFLHRLEHFPRAPSSLRATRGQPSRPKGSRARRPDRPDRPRRPRRSSTRPCFRRGTRRGRRLTASDRPRDGEILVPASRETTRPSWGRRWRTGRVQ